MASQAIPETMRAAQWTKPPIESSLKLNANVPVPADAPAAKLPKDSALIKVAYASINPVDYKVPENGLARALALGKAPWTPGGDYAGTVIASNMSHVKAGDLVGGCLPIPPFGSLAEYIIVKGSVNVSKVPEGVDLKDAAALPIAAQTAYQCIAPNVKQGDKVLINGASGGTGTFGVQIAKILGCTVTAVCSAANADLVKSLGADEVLDYKSVDVVQELSKGGLEYDLIVDNVAVGGQIYKEAHNFLKTTGKYVSIAGGPDLDSIKGMVAMFAQPSWLGGGRRKGGFVARAANREELEKLYEWIKEGKLKPFIENVYELDAADEAFKRLKSGRTRGKLMIKVAQD